MTREHNKDERQKTPQADFSRGFTGCINQVACAALGEVRVPQPSSIGAQLLAPKWMSRRGKLMFLPRNSRSWLQQELVAKMFDQAVPKRRIRCRIP